MKSSRRDPSKTSVELDSLPSTVLLVLDDQRRVVFDSIRGIGKRAFLDHFFDSRSGTLVEQLDVLVREASDRFTEHRFCDVSLTGLEGGPQSVYIVPVVGESGMMFVITVDLVRSPEPILRAVRRFSLTPRETEVLGAILNGSSTIEIAALLHLAESTVQVYQKRLLSKSRSRSRSAMVAKVLDWNAWPVDSDSLQERELGA